MSYSFRVVRVSEGVTTQDGVAAITKATNVINQWSEAGWELISITPVSMGQSDIEQTTFDALTGSRYVTDPHAESHVYLTFRSGSVV